MKLYLCMNELAIMYVYVYMSLCFMLLDSVLINFICNCILCMHEFAFMYAGADSGGGGAHPARAPPLKLEKI